jgi:hypothetical protein
VATGIAALIDPLGAGDVAAHFAGFVEVALLAVDVGGEQQRADHESVVFGRLEDVLDAQDAQGARAVRIGDAADVEGLDHVFDVLARGVIPALVVEGAGEEQLSPDAGVVLVGDGAGVGPAVFAVRAGSRPPCCG